jgi:hypothetical protein
MEWAGSTDDFIPYNITRKRADLYAAGDYDYEFVTWHGPSSGHLLMCNNGTWDVMTKWLGDMKRVVDPVRVTYVRNPLMDDPGAGLVGNRAYWVSGIETRDQALGTIDVISDGFETGPAEARHKETENLTIPSDGIYLSTGFDQPDRRYAIPQNAYTREFRHLGSGPSHTPGNSLTITAKNIGTLTIDPQRAKVSCDAELDVRTDGPLSITLLGCGGGPRNFG